MMVTGSVCAPARQYSKVVQSRAEGAKGSKRLNGDM